MKDIERIEKMQIAALWRLYRQACRARDWFDECEPGDIGNQLASLTHEIDIYTGQIQDMSRTEDYC